MNDNHLPLPEKIASSQTEPRNDFDEENVRNPLN